TVHGDAPPRVRDQALVRALTVEAEQPDVARVALHLERRVGAAAARPGDEGRTPEIFARNEHPARGIAIGAGAHAREEELLVADRAPHPAPQDTGGSRGSELGARFVRQELEHSGRSVLLRAPNRLEVPPAPDGQHHLVGVARPGTTAKADRARLRVRRNAAAERAAPDDLAGRAISASDRRQPIPRATPPGARRPFEGPSVQVTNAEVAPARDAQTARTQTGLGAGATAIGAIAIPVLVHAIVRPLARALPLELGAQALVARSAHRGGLLARHARERDRSLFVRVRKDVDVIAVQHHLLARHLGVGDAGQPIARSPGDERPRRNPDHALAERRRGRRWSDRAREDGARLRLRRRATVVARRTTAERAHEHGHADAHGRGNPGATPRVHDSRVSSRSRSPSSFILSCRPLREILSNRAAWVTLPDVCSRAFTISSRSRRLIAAFTCSFKPSCPPAPTCAVTCVVATGGACGVCPRISPGMSDTSIAALSQKSTARSITFSSSRMLPGQGYAASKSSAAPSMASTFFFKRALNLSMKYRTSSG